MSARSLVKHYGPGPHPGTGTEQTIHAPGGALNVEAADSHLRTKFADVLERFPGAPESFTFEGGMSPAAYRWIVNLQSEILDNEVLRDEWDGRVVELLRELREIEKEHTGNLYKMLATNKISPEEALNLGLSEYDQEMRELGELPKTVYHVTTDTSAVLETGLKSREELGQGSGVGLGGGTSDTISFTSSPEVAEGILFSMRERHAVLNDPATEIPRLIEEAKRGHNADRPWWGQLDQNSTLAIKWEGEKADRLSGGIERLIEGTALHHTTLPTTADDLRANWGSKGHWRQRSFDLDSIRPLDDSGTVWEIRYHEAGHAEAIGDFMDEYSLYRSTAGGPMDPLFIMNDDLAFKNKDPNDFSILKGRTIEGAKGYQVSSMGEWRTWTGDVLESMEVLK